MAEKGIPDFMREFDMNIDYGFTPVSSKPVEQKPGVDKQALDSKFEGENSVTPTPTCSLNPLEIFF